MSLSWSDPTVSAGRPSGGRTMVKHLMKLVVFLVKENMELRRELRDARDES